MNAICVRLTTFRLHIILTGFALLATAGCAHMKEVKVQPSPLPPRTGEQKVPVRVALVLDDTLSGHKLESKQGAYLLGPALTQYARQVTESTFTQVATFLSLDAAANQADVILHPAPGKTEATGSATVDPFASMGVRGKRYIMLVVEWTLLDRTGKDTLWLRGVAGNSSRTVTFAQIVGVSPTGNKRERIAFQALFDDLAQRTQKAFDESQEIQRLGKPAAQ